MENPEQKDKPEALQELNQKIATIDTRNTALQKNLSALGKQYTTLSNVLKTRHETAKN
ncbi:MAG: hypothetical protein JST17_06285 [Bacteroidetes bacterium]|nr:hypothetical protein [Bacteroidota bacterium]MBS1929833.1 hypothetical protein [Bacteroidota bacterium]